MTAGHHPIHHVLFVLIFLLWLVSRTFILLEQSIADYDSASFLPSVSDALSARTLTFGLRPAYYQLVVTSA